MEDIIIAVLGLILTIVTTIIAIIDAKSKIQEKKINGLILSHKILANGYWRIHENTINLYYKKIKPEGLIEPESSSKVPPMLYKDSWLYSGGDVKKLSDIKLECVEQSQNKCNKKLKHLIKRISPYPQKTFEQNLSLICDISLYNSCIYVPIEYTNNDETKLSVTKQNYFDFLNTCIPFSYADALSTTSKEKYLNKARFAFNPFDFSNRVSQVGIDTLTILYNVIDDENFSGNTRYFILHKRSNDVAESRGMIHTIPAGTYQPSYYDGNEKPDELGCTVFREFGEELLGYKEFTELNDTQAICSVFSEDIYGMNERVVYLGAAINPVSLHLELLTILPMDMSEEKNKKVFNGRNLSEIKKAIKENEECASIFLEEFNKQKMIQYTHMHLSTPALKQIMTICYDHYDDLESILFK